MNTSFIEIYRSLELEWGEELIISANFALMGYETILLNIKFAKKKLISHFCVVKVA